MLCVVLGLGLGLGLVVAPLSAVGCVGFGVRVRSGGSAIECCGLCWVWG